MAEITCPNCNNTLSEKDTVCENCGWNSAESDAEKKAPPKVVSGEKLTQEDLEAFQEGEAVIEFQSEKSKKPAKQKKEKNKDESKGDKHRSIKDIKEDVRNFIKNGIDNSAGAEIPLNEGVFSFQNIDAPESIASASGGAAQEAGGAPSADEFPDLSVFDAIAEKTEKKGFIKGKISGLFGILTSSVLRLIVMILLIVGAFGLGILISNFYHSNMYVDRTYDLAANSVNAVISKMAPEESLYIQRIYVRPSKEISECIIFASVGTSLGEFYNTNYRLVIDMENPENTTLYYAFDPARYEELKNGTPEEAVTASVMMSHYDSFKRSLNEIREGKNGWKESNAAYINLLVSEKRK